MTRNDEKEKEELKQRLVQEFEQKELGRLKYFLGTEVTYSNQGILISHRKYITNLLVDIGCRFVSTPMDPKQVM